MTQSQQLRKLAARSATAFLLAALCVFPLYIDKFSTSALSNSPASAP
mgnify:FL=1